MLLSNDSCVITSHTHKKNYDGVNVEANCHLEHRIFSHPSKLVVATSFTQGKRQCD